MDRAFALVFSAAFMAYVADAAPPTSWVDKDTGHRIVRLTDDRDILSRGQYGPDAQPDEPQSFY